MSIELVIFDCDGVLFDSAVANTSFYNKILSSQGFDPLEPSAAVAAQSMTTDQLFGDRFGRDQELRERLGSVARATDYGPFFDLMGPRTDLHDILADIHTRYRTAMATNRGKTVGEVVHRFNLTDVLDLWVGVNDVERPKPYPDLIEHCLDHFEVEPSRAVYVGDQATDLEAAQQAGTHFIAMPPVSNSWQPAIADLTELAEAVKGLESRQPRLGLYAKTI